MDHVNCSNGLGTLRLASAGISSAWVMKREKMSAVYNTRWDELPVVLALTAASDIAYQCVYQIKNGLQ